MTQDETRQLVRDIAMNCTRIGNWAADDYVGKKKRVIMFLDQTNEYVARVSAAMLPPAFRRVFQRFASEYPKLHEEGKRQPADTARFAERMMTWGNILTHRSSLIP